MQVSNISIKKWLEESREKLSTSGIDSALLDCEILLSFVLGKDRTYLHAHGEDLIPKNKINKANRCINKRQKRIPIAYITGRKEFYGRDFIVSKSTLIPRPESETIIDILKSLPIEPGTKLVDIGTGTGCLGITSKLELSKLQVSLIDISLRALSIASTNAKVLDANVNLVHGNLLNNYTEKIDIILANLPYVDKTWERSPETDFEPTIALFAPDNGLRLIHKLLSQTDALLKNNGYIIIEADPRQHEDILAKALDYNLKIEKTKDFILLLKKTSI